jgi:acyl-CoA hydrolase
MYERYMAHMAPRVSIVLMSRPDEEGYCNIGPNGYTPAGLDASEVIIAQVTKHMPRVNGTCHRYHVSQLAAIVEADDEMAIVNNPAATPVEEQIAGHILNYIPDGACIQLGFGGIANAVGFGLKDKRHLGVHTEVLTESIVDLMECGAIDNSRKTVLPGQTAVGFVIGSQRQYRFIDQNEDLIFDRFSEIVNIKNIAANDNMISINGAVSVDLTGQVCAESIGRRQYSGTGGQLDFVRGASLSKGGASFIAIPSTVKTKEGVKSRIVLDLAPGSIVTTPRTDVQHVVTEYGVATLQFCDVPERVRRLVSIAHPDFRDELLFQAKQAGLVF